MRSLFPTSEFTTHHPSLATTLKFFLFTFLRTLLHFFALPQNSTLLFSSASALCVKKPSGVPPSKFIPGVRVSPNSSPRQGAGIRPEDSFQGATADRSLPWFSPPAVRGWKDPLLSLPCFFHRPGNDFADSFAQRRHVFFRKSPGLDGVVHKNRNFRRPQHPAARPVMMKRSHETHGYDRNAELLRNAKAAVLELIHVPVARPLRFGKNNQAGAAVDGVLREAPHALQIRRAPDIWYRDVAEALHQPAVRGNLKVGFQLPSAHKLRDRAVEHERIEKIDVIRHEERSLVGIKARRAADLDLRAGKKRDAAAEGALQPIMFTSIQKDAEKDEQGHDEEEMQDAEDPKNRAAENQPGPFHL